MCKCRFIKYTFFYNRRRIRLRIRIRVVQIEVHVLLHRRVGYGAVDCSSKCVRILHSGTRGGQGLGRGVVGNGQWWWVLEKTNCSCCTCSASLMASGQTDQSQGESCPWKDFFLHCWGSVKSSCPSGRRGGSPRASAWLFLLPLSAASPCPPWYSCCTVLSCSSVIRLSGDGT